MGFLPTRTWGDPLGNPFLWEAAIQCTILHVDLSRDPTLPRPLPCSEDSAYLCPIREQDKLVYPCHPASGNKPWLQRRLQKGCAQPALHSFTFVSFWYQQVDNKSSAKEKPKPGAPMGLPGSAPPSYCIWWTSNTTASEPRESPHPGEFQAEAVDAAARNVPRADGSTPSPPPQNRSTTRGRSNGPAGSPTFFYSVTRGPAFGYTDTLVLRPQGPR